MRSLFSRKAVYSTCCALAAVLCLGIAQARAEKVYVGNQEVELPPAEVTEPAPSEKPDQNSKKEPAKPENLKLNADPCPACGMG